MPIILRSQWDRLDFAEQGRRIAEGCVVKDDDWQEREARAERVRSEMAEWRAAHSIKRKDFDALPAGERVRLMREGFEVTD